MDAFQPEASSVLVVRQTHTCSSSEYRSDTMVPSSQLLILYMYKLPRSCTLQNRSPNLNNQSMFKLPM